jgi:hypothetical protein
MRIIRVLENFPSAPNSNDKLEPSGAIAYKIGLSSPKTASRALGVIPPYAEMFNFFQNDSISVI